MTRINVNFTFNNANIYEQKAIDKKWEDITYDDVRKTLPEKAILRGYALAPEEYRQW